MEKNLRVNFIRLLLILTMFITISVEAKTHRSSAVKAEFQRKHPCPSTGEARGACPGWVKDHIIALECNGADSVENMQWQTISDSKAKDRWERRGCKK
jgi:hypothetical protein